MSVEPFELLEEIAMVWPADRWMLVGGLMVHAHAELAGVRHARPTSDVDLVVELKAGSYLDAATVLQRLGFDRAEPVDPRAPFHRFKRGQDQIDLMAPDGAQVRLGGRDVIRAPGS